MGMFPTRWGTTARSATSGAALDRAKFAEVTRALQRARGMIAMMQTINKSYFAGAPRVTCFTCHHGNQSPRSDPNIALQYSTPEEDPNARDFATEPRSTRTRSSTNTCRPSGGADRLARLTSLAAKGTYAGFDTLFEKVPVEIFAKAPNQYSTIVHMAAGNSVRTFNGGSGWMADPTRRFLSSR